VKECLALDGSPATFGIETRKALLDTRDEAHVRRLRDAGAIVLGKSNVSQLLIYLEADNPVYGRTNHPSDAERSPGGSSGGEAALVASGGSALGVGTDIGGSSRVPAAMCGSVGFKASEGTMPDDGRFSVPVGQRAIQSQVGLLGRSVGDVALAFAVASANAAPATRALRVGYFETDGLFEPAPAVRRAVREAAQALERSGVPVKRLTPPSLDEAESLFFGIISGDGMAHGRRALRGSTIDPRVKQVIMAARAPGFVRTLLRLSGRAGALRMVRNYGRYDCDSHWRRVESLLDYRTRVREAMREAGVDVLLSPGCALPAVRHGATLELGVMGAYTILYNVLGFAAGVVPWTRVGQNEESDRAPSKDKMMVVARECERGSAGLPVAVQLACPDDHLALEAMRQVEALSPFTRA
jgi:fatty acid amide hydrolase